MSNDMEQVKREADYMDALEDHKTAIIDHNHALNIRAKLYSEVNKYHAEKDEAYQALKSLRGNRKQLRANKRLRDDLGEQAQKLKQELANGKTKAQKRNLRQKLDQVEAELKSVKTAIKKQRENYHSAEVAFHQMREVTNNTHRLINRAHRRCEQTYNKLMAAKQNLRKCAELRVTDNERARVLKASDLPPSSRHEVKILKNEIGDFDVYYGGQNKPDGAGHGHVAMDKYLNVSYHRKPDNEPAPVTTQRHTR